MKSPVKWLTTTDHKTIGTLYLITSFAFFCVGGLLALLMRAELARPGHQILSNEQFNQAFTMHGTIMLLMFATPLFSGFANWITSAGSPMRRSPTPCIPRASAATCGSWAWPCPASGRSWARSISSPPSSVCARPA